MDYDALEKAINEHTKAIIPIDLGGVPCDYDRIFEIVNKKKNLFRPSNKIQEAIGRIAVVDDAAHAIGASYKGKMVGSIADFTNFSFPTWRYHQNCCYCCLVAKSCPTLCHRIDCSQPGSSVLGISQARTLKWVAISFARGSSQPKD